MVTCYLVLVKRSPGFRDEVGAAHGRFIDTLREQGNIAMTGGFSDRSGGAYILQNLPDLAAAQALVATDPLVVEHCADVSIHEWNTR